MYKMLEVMLKVILLMGLFFAARLDYKTKMIEQKWLLILGTLGFLGNLFLDDKTFLYQTLMGTLVGMVLLLFARFSGESIGFGDGWLFTVTGIFLGFWGNLALLGGSMFLAGIFSVACFITKKKGRHDRIAFVPFVLVAYVIFIL